MSTASDPRPLYRDALAWVASLIDEVRPEQMTDPTPCPEYDVRALLGHLVATVDRGRVIGSDGDPLSVPEFLTGVPDDAWHAELERAQAHYRKVWSDDDLLDRPVVAPWGTVPGRAAVLSNLNEALVHGWDLAVATGLPAEPNPVLVEAAFVVARSKIPASVRGGRVPFGAAVEPAPDASPVERLANWSGRDTAAWRR
ncbi:hypothetical protein GQ85_21635 [Rhodococcus rhodochrous]|nr:hypothetical protein GQ85_21635 [Rhodococcus rhodochrous]